MRAAGRRRTPRAALRRPRLPLPPARDHRPPPRATPSSTGPSTSWPASSASSPSTSSTSTSTTRTRLAAHPRRSRSRPSPTDLGSPAMASSKEAARAGRPRAPAAARPRRADAGALRQGQRQRRRPAPSPTSRSCPSSRSWRWRSSWSASSPGSTPTPRDNLSPRSATCCRASSATATARALATSRTPLPGIVGHRPGPGVLYAGLGWLSAMRTALIVVFEEPEREQPELHRRQAARPARPCSSSARADRSASPSPASSSGFATPILDFLGLGAGARAPVVELIALVLGLAANTVLFFAFFRLLASPERAARSLWSGALLGAIGFEVLKQLSTCLLADQGPARVPGVRDRADPRRLDQLLLPGRGATPRRGPTPRSPPASSANASGGETGPSSRARRWTSPRRLAPARSRLRPRASTRAPLPRAPA